MNRLIVLGVSLALGGAAWFWMNREISKDPGITVFLAFGDPDEEMIDIQCAVDMAMPRRQGPRISADGSMRWDEWVPEHFKIYDESGSEVEIARTGQSLLFDETKIPGAPEFYLRAKLRPGKKYTFDYIPRTHEPKCYRYQFDAPSEKTKMARTTLPLVGQ